MEGIAVREFQQARWSNYDSSTCPYGAGLCVRACVADRYAQIAVSDLIRRSLGRRENSLIGGGDLDLAMTSYQLGMGTGLFPQLKLLHLIPKHRVESDYLYRICVGGTYAHHLVNFLHCGQQFQARKSHPSLRRMLRRIKQLLPRRWISSLRKSCFRRNSARRGRHTSSSTQLAFAWGLSPFRVSAVEPNTW